MSSEPDGTSALLRLGYRIMLVAGRLNWAEPELRGLRALVKPGDAVVDIGAAHGMYAVTLARLVGATGSVDAFEPHPRQQRTLRGWRRLLKAPQIRIHAGAAGRERGTLTMRLPIVLGLPIYGRAHLTDGAAPQKPGERVRHWSTPITAVDDWVEEAHVGRVSFMKADVEGFEPQVLEGAARTITRDLPSLLLEIEDRHLARYGSTALGVTAEIHRRWPQYGMYTWQRGAWVRTEAVTLATRNYLFATDHAFGGLHAPAAESRALPDRGPAARS